MSPLIELTSSQTFVPATTPTLMSPETDLTEVSPRLTARRAASPETESTRTSPPT